MIEIRNVSKTFRTKDKEVIALKNINLEISKGDIYGLIGYSGAGKSTLVRMINLLEVPDEGEVIINGTIINNISKKELRGVRNNIGMIFQHFNLMNSIDVYNNIALPLKNKGYSKSEINNKVKNLLGLVGLEDKEHAYPRELSGGQKQRVAIARALGSDPEILLCDEATSALDPNTTKSILELLKEIQNKLGITIVMITHQMEVVKNICNKVAIMENGGIVEKGNIVDIFTSPRAKITKDFVAHSMGSDEILNKLKETKQNIYKITFSGDVTHEPIISKITTDYEVKVNILFGNIENLMGTVIGSLMVEFIGDSKNIDDAIKFYKEIGANVEVIKNA
jgi:D-methionine transport system ATP-binding protein